MDQVEDDVTSGGEVDWGGEDDAGVGPSVGVGPAGPSVGVVLVECWSSCSERLNVRVLLHL